MGSKDEDKAKKKSSSQQKISSRYDELSKPNHPHDSIKKPPPKEKNKYGQPIYSKPKYGRVFPHVKPFKELDCKEFMKKKKEKEIEDKLKNKNKEMSIDPIAFKSTIDPYFDPAGAKRQLRARKMVKKIARDGKKNKNSK